MRAARLGPTLALALLAPVCGPAGEQEGAADTLRDGWLADTQYVVDSSGARLEIIIGRPPGAAREILPREGAGDPDAPDAFRILEPPVAHTMMQAAGSPGWYVIDLRSAEAYAAEGHIGGAALVPGDLLEKNLGDLHVRSDQMVLLYAESTPRAREAARVMAAHGYPNIRVLAGGLPAWKAAGLPVEAAP